jgi:hypothetical protein
LLFTVFTPILPPAYVFTNKVYLNTSKGEIDN